ncbi:MAG: DUF1311 domain-containing protein [Gammaproteobacteria bacterium]|nr:DUF1311 domain-containing protein [Gammaproteobacteria bacterium]
MKLLYAFVLIISATSCMAQTPKISHAEKKLDCTDITTSPQLDACVHHKMVQSNALLMNEFSEFEKRVKQTYTADLKLGNDLIEKVRKAQNAWVTYRQLNCSVEAFGIEEGTPAYNTTVNNCIIRMNTKRIKALKKLPN